MVGVGIWVFLKGVLPEVLVVGLVDVVQQLGVGERHLVATAVPGQGKHLEVVLFQAGHVDLGEVARVVLGIHPPVVLQVLAVAELCEFAVFTEVRGRGAG